MHEAGTVRGTQIAYREPAMNELDGCIRTLDQTQNELADIEHQLAIRYDIRRNVRRVLIERDRAGELPEDELVADWHDVYSAYLNYLRANAHEDGADPPLSK